MGLDMYLERKTYVQNWDHLPAEKRHEIKVKLGGKKHPFIKPERISEITEQVAYWRKANAIHSWFVEKVQKGVDDCGEYRVEREQLQELKTACDKVLAASKQTHLHRDRQAMAGVAEEEGQGCLTLSSPDWPRQCGHFFSRSPAHGTRIQIAARAVRGSQGCQSSRRAQRQD